MVYLAVSVDPEIIRTVYHALYQGASIVEKKIRTLRSRNYAIVGYINGVTDVIITCIMDLLYMDPLKTNLTVALGNIYVHIFLVEQYKRWKLFLKKTRLALVRRNSFERLNSINLNIIKK